MPATNISKIEQIRQWREAERKAGRPHGLEDFCNAHGIPHGGIKQPMPTTPTPGAVRAARRWFGDSPFLQLDARELAVIIDEETHAGELLEAMKALFKHCAMIHKYWGDSDNTKEADAAIEAATATLTAATKE